MSKIPLLSVKWKQSFNPFVLCAAALLFLIMISTDLCGLTKFVRKYFILLLIWEGVLWQRKRKCSWMIQSNQLSHRFLKKYNTCFPREDEDGMNQSRMKWKLHKSSKSVIITCQTDWSKLHSAFCKGYSRLPKPSFPTLLPSSFPLLHNLVPYYLIFFF